LWHKCFIINFKTHLIYAIFSERSLPMTGVNNVSGNGQEALGTQTANTLSEPEGIGKGGLDAGNMPVESGGSDVEAQGGINPETSPKEYADGSAEKVSGFEELGSQDAESAKKEQNDNTQKVLQAMGQIYIGAETSPESLGETAGEGAEGAEGAAKGAEGAEGAEGAAKGAAEGAEEIPGALA
jgi:hypothetical protein